MTQARLDDLAMELALDLMNDDADRNHRQILRKIEAIQRSLRDGLTPTTAVQGALGLATLEFARDDDPADPRVQRAVKSAKALARKAGYL